MKQPRGFALYDIVDPIKMINKIINKVEGILEKVILMI